MGRPKRNVFQQLLLLLKLVFLLRTSCSHRVLRTVGQRFVYVFFPLLYEMDRIEAEEFRHFSLYLSLFLSPG